MSWEYSLTSLASAIGSDSPREERYFSSISTDTRTLKVGDVFFALAGERFDANEFLEKAFEQGACAAVATRPCEKGPCLVVHDTLRALQSFAQWHREHFTLPVIAITGSCGKTMAKDLMAGVLGTRYRVVKTRGNLNNDIGVPLTLAQIDHKAERAVIEMGANHPGEIAALCDMARPTEAAITMIAPAHLEGFGTIEQVAAAKAEILEGLGWNGVFYVNNDDPRCIQIAEQFEGEVLRFGFSGDVTLRRREVLESGETLLEIDPVGRVTLPLPCPAHATNVLLAVAVGMHHGIEEFEGPLRHALAETTRFRIFRLGPWEILDDTYNANPASMAAALEALAARSRPGYRVAALGDMLELGAASKELHRQLGRKVAACSVSHLFVRGDFADDVVAGALEAGCPHPVAVEAPEEIAVAVRALEPEGGALLAKGSRGMRMERVIEALRQMYK